MYSTAVNPASAARRKRSRKSTSVNIIVRLAASWIMVSSWLRGGHAAGEHVREEQRDQPHDDRQREAVAQREQKQTRFVLSRHTGRCRGNRDALQRDHLAE